MPLNAWSRLYNLWNRESVVMNHGIYVYQLDDFIQSLTPKITSVLGHDKALKKVTDYYKEKTEARQSICYIIINKNESYSIRQIHSQIQT